MKTIAILATTIVGLDCINNAVDSSAQVFFTEQFNWVWWIAAVVWFSYAIRFFFINFDHD